MLLFKSIVILNFKDVVELDLSSLESVRRCANLLLERYTQINILVCNAGVSIPPKMGIKTTEGYEINFGVNHLGHFLLTKLLVDRLKASAPSRYHGVQIIYKLKSSS